MVIVFIMGALIVALSVSILIPNYRDRYKWKGLPNDDPTALSFRGSRYRAWIGIAGGFLITTLCTFDPETRILVCIASAGSMLAGFYVVMFGYEFRYSQEAESKISDLRKFQKENEEFMDRLAAVFIMWGGSVFIGVLIFTMV